jgi:HTH-type transcriptional regulator/antitoxin HipB
MLLTTAALFTLAHHLTVERKRQGLSRMQAAAVCNVSPSFIRDAESDPARCSMGLLLQYMTGLGLSVEVTGWPHDDVPHASLVRRCAAAV